jgi:hypothetical protein
MPTPKQSRFSTPNRSATDAAGLSQNFTALEQAIDGLPHFPTYRVSRFPGANVSMASSVPVPVNIGYENLGISGFRKIEAWTDVEVRLRVTTKSPTPATDAVFYVRFESEGGPTFQSPFTFVASTNNDAANVRFAGYGEVGVTGIPPGRYRVAVFWARDGGTISIDFSSLFQLAVTESIPVPPTL